VSAVYASTPWGVLAKPVTPISFERDSPPFQTLSRKLEGLQTKHRQATWESTHSLPISEDLRRAVKYFTILYAERMQRRSRFGAAWKNFLKFVLLSIVAGHCDLDILLDPVFLHFPRPGEPANLFQALRDADRQDPWRNQYRHPIEDHPGYQLPVLRASSSIRSSFSVREADPHSRRPASLNHTCFDLVRTMCVALVPSLLRG
ncbi:hypothetical protein PHMEG_00019790, partial [Phytophthora megakarya]